MVRFFCYSQYHGKPELVGSDYIRAKQLLKYWPEAGLYQYGENPDVLIFQKVFISQDYKFPAHFENTKILDMCDPMWLDGHNVVETAHAMDAITCPTEPLAEFLRQFHKKVVVIKDRFDMELIPEPKKHEGEAETVVWFGYSHNSASMKLAMPKLDAKGLKLIVISNEDPIIYRWSNREMADFYTFVRYDEDTIYEELQKADYAILPDNQRPVDVFKSNNRVIKANLAGLPVAKTSEQVDLYMSAENRQKWVDTNYGKIKEEYDVKHSIKEYKQLIKELREKTGKYGKP